MAVARHASATRSRPYPRPKMSWVALLVSRRHLDDDGLPGTYALGVRSEEAEPRDPVLLVVDRRHARRQFRVAHQLGLPDEVRPGGTAHPDQERTAAPDAPRLVAVRAGREV